MDFETYLIGKKIDAALFRSEDPALWERWRVIFEEMHPASFTMQKLNLINPIRRKYPLKALPPVVEPSAGDAVSKEVKPLAASPGVKPAKPVFRPKPKLK